MKRVNFNLKTLAWLILCLSLTSCFDVIDEINLKKDGSGEFLLTVNMSKSKTRLESIMLLETFREYRVPTKEEVEVYIDDLVVFLEGSEGLSNVKRTLDFEEFIFTIGFDFESLDNINDAIVELSDRDTNNNKRNNSFTLRYSFDSQTREFTKYYRAEAATDEDFESLDEEDKKRFNEAVYISISRFETPVSHCSNKRAKISKSGKAVMMRTPAVGIMRGNTSITNTIQLK